MIFILRENINLRYIIFLGNEGKGVMDTLKEYVAKFDVMNSLLGDFMDSNEIGGNL